MLLLNNLNIVLLLGDHVYQPEILDSRVEIRCSNIVEVIGDCGLSRSGMMIAYLPLLHVVLLFLVLLH